MKLIDELIHKLIRTDHWYTWYVLPTEQYELNPFAIAGLLCIFIIATSLVTGK